MSTTTTDPTTDRTAATETASGRLRAKIALAYPSLVFSSERIWTSPSVRELYPAYLATMHGVVRSATPLMEAALDRAERLAPNDAVASGLAPYLAHHAPEEAGHQRWLLEDLAALGHDAAEPLTRMPSSRVAELVGAQYYWLRHHHPVALLGHMAVVEGNPPRPGFADRLRASTGYPRDAFRTIARHEELDGDHAAELWDVIDGLPLQPEHETIMGISALHTIEAATAVFDEIFIQVTAGPGAR